MEPLFREDELRCPHCRLCWTPARVVEHYSESRTDAHGNFTLGCFIPSSKIRCVGCKQDVERPLTDDQKQLVRAEIDRWARQQEGLRDSIFSISLSNVEK